MVKLQIAILLLGLMLGVIWDLRSRRIPNALTLGMAVSGLVAFTTLDGAQGLVASIGGMTLGFAVFVVPFAMGGIGGGDVKLAMAVGAVAGPGAALRILLLGAVAGGIIALGVLVYQSDPVRYACRRFLGQRDPVSRTDASKKAVGFPYAVAIAIGAVLSFADVPGRFM